MFYRERHFISAQDATREGLITLFKRSRKIKNRLKTSNGRRKLATELFREDNSPHIVKIAFWGPSSRTFDSFLEAVRRLGGEPRENMHMEIVSSVAKGETIEDVILMNLMYEYDALVIRHDGSEPNALRRAADTIEAYGKETPIVSAGEGNREHPTQMVLDLFTVWERRRPEFEEGKLTWAFVGDLSESRTIHSAIIALRNFGGCVYLVSFPENNVPDWVYQAVDGKFDIIKMESWEKIAPKVDVWYFTRLQKNLRTREVDPEYERLYVERYGANEEFLRAIDKNALILHPLPHGPEIPWVHAPLYDERVIYDDQMYNGLITRMALFTLIPLPR